MQSNVKLFVAVPEELGAPELIPTITGIGKLNAASSVYRYLSSLKKEERPDIILNVGTVGSHKFPVGTILLVESSIDGTVLADEKSTQRLNVPERLSGEYERATVYSSDFFVSEKLFPKSFVDSIKSKADAFDMELSAIVRAARDFDIKVVSVKVVSDNLDGSVVDWREALKRVQPILKKFIIENFS